MSEIAERSITQIAESLAGKRSFAEIVDTIFAHRPTFDIFELAELLDRAKEIQSQAEELEAKAATLMDVVGEIMKEFCAIEMTSSSATAQEEAALKAPAA